MKCICEIIEVGCEKEITYDGYVSLILSRHQDKSMDGFCLEATSDEGNPMQKIFYCPFCGRDLD